MRKAVRDSGMVLCKDVTFSSCKILPCTKEKGYVRPSSLSSGVSRSGGAVEGIPRIGASPDITSQDLRITERWARTGRSYPWNLLARIIDHR